MAANAAGISNKKEGLINIIESENINTVQIQETKLF